MILTDKVYTVLKWFCIVFMPAFTTFFGIVGTTLGFQYTEQILTIMTAFTTFLGGLVGVSSMNYKKGE